MKVELNITPDCPEHKVIICADRMTDEIEALLRFLDQSAPDTLTVQTATGVEMLPVREIIRVYSQRQRVYVETASGVYPVKARLYEMEARLEGRSFVRISNAELVNTCMITGMDFSLSGTIRLTLKGGIATYVSRRRVKEIKRMFDV